MRKRIAILISIFLLTGCWDRREINDVAFVTGSAIDWEDEKYMVSIQVPLPGQMGGAGSEGGGGGTGGGKPWYMDTQVANSVREAKAIQQARTSRALYFAHRRVILIGETMAKHGIEEMIDVFGREPEIRLTAYAVVSKGQAKDALSVPVPIEIFPAEMVRELAFKSMKNPPSFKSLIHLMLADGIDPALPMVHVKNIPNGEQQLKTIEMRGLAVFNKENKLAGFLEGEEANGVLWAMNEASAPELVVSPPNGTGKISIRFHQNEAELKPQIRGDSITMGIEVRAKGSILENESKVNVAKDLNQLETWAKKELEQQIKKSIYSLQTKYHSDPVGFGDAIYRKHPKEWNKIKDRWDDIYPRVQVQVTAMIHIENPGAVTQPFGVKERRIKDD